MRYQTWGISRTRLQLFTWIPAIAWAAFRVQSLPELSVSAIFLYYREFIWVAGGTLALLSLVWIYLFRRGLFGARYVLYVVMTAELFYELLQSVESRDLLHLISALVYFGFMIVAYRWMEAWVELAAFNPKLRWFEGRPKSIPHVTVKVRAATGTDEDEKPWIDAEVRRLDPQGLFLVFREPAADSGELKLYRKLEFKLLWKNREVVGEGQLMGKLMDDAASQQVAGIGLLFYPKGLYHLIQYTALYQALKGEGYAF